MQTRWGISLLLYYCAKIIPSEQKEDLHLQCTEACYAISFRAYSTLDSLSLEEIPCRDILRRDAKSYMLVQFDLSRYGK
ncbi:hypothetical protein SLEP1_g59710 [Rubroshorea leprosula]|uniref:Uncharacterized protein n=1 Tax=Rubroshorea leprosula TaxID=152421 RepID=A0AAV5MX80_9ROSI|nr:hypothetical protein SLEP1_g59710 [Rubroshorea leprosula]